MSNNKVNKTEENLAAVESALGKTEHFVEKNKKLLSYITFGVVAIVLLGFLLNSYYFKPRKAAAHESIFYAERFFQLDSLDKALYGDGTHMGFIELSEKYSSTKSGNLAKYYAGICFLHKGGNDSTAKGKEFFNQAISYLEDFDTDDAVVGAMAKGAIGDANMELGNMDKAASFYVEAARFEDNKFTTPYFLKKAGMTYSLLNQHDKALEMYKEISSVYFSSFEGREIKKYIALEEQILGK